jgi:hypothetical protein
LVLIKALCLPWHGEVEVCDPGKVEIEKIFFLGHAEKTYVERISAADAAERMFVRCLPTFWDKEGDGAYPFSYK